MLGNMYGLWNMVWEWIWSHSKHTIVGSYGHFGGT
jgi:hypothetical protein